jgi:hypothetical protein
LVRLSGPAGQGLHRVPGFGHNSLSE